MPALKPDDFKKGMYVTVLNGPMELYEHPMVPAIKGGCVTMKENNQLNGVPLKILEIELPYIVLSEAYRDKPFIIDVRSQVEFMKIPKEYVKSLGPKRKPRK